MSNYRDDLIAAQARIEALERQVADKDREIEALAVRDEALEFRSAVLARPKTTKVSRLLGGPLAVSFERRWTGSLSDSELADLADYLDDSHNRAGTVSFVPGTLRYELAKNSNKLRSVRIVSDSDLVVLEWSESLAFEAGIIFGAVGGAVGLNAGIQSLVWMPLLALPILTLSYLGCRLGFQAASRRKLRRARRHFEELSKRTELLVSETPTS